MKAKIYLKYSFDKQNGLDLESLGESFIGFNRILKDIFEVSNLTGDIEIKTEKITEGSVLLHVTQEILSPQFFNNISDFLNFLSLADHTLFEHAQNYFNAIENVHKL